MNKFRIGCFYSENSPYSKVFEQYLEASCNKLKLPIYLEVTPNFHEWKRNVAEKPRVIFDALNALPQDNCFVMLDADATVEKYPILFETIPEEYDIAFYTLNWNEWYGYEDNPPKLELLSGTMFFRNNDRVKSLCRAWYSKALEEGIWEQKCLQQIIDRYDVKVYDLPLSYCYMKSRPGNKEPLIKVDPVILHHQVSRELKKKPL